MKLCEVSWSESTADQYIQRSQLCAYLVYDLVPTLRPLHSLLPNMAVEYVQTSLFKSLAAILKEPEPHMNVRFIAGKKGTVTVFSDYFCHPKMAA